MLILEKHTMRASNILSITTVLYGESLFLEISFIDGRVEYMEFANDLLITIEREAELEE